MNDMERLSALHAIMPSNYSATLQEIAEYLYLALLNHSQAKGVDDEETARIALSQAEYLRDRMAGNQLYIPKTDKIKLVDRDYEIYRKFTGNNYKELAQEYNLSSFWVRTIIATIQDEVFRKNQGRFDF